VVGGLVRLQEYGWSLGNSTCRTAGLDEPAVQTAGLEEAGRGTPGARKEPQNPYPESIHFAHTVTDFITFSF